MSKLSPSPGMLSAPIAASVMSKVPETTNSSPSRTTLMDSSWPAPNVSSGSPSKVVVVPMYSPSSYGSDWTFGAGQDETMSVVRDGDEFVVSGTMDLSEAALGAESMPGLGDSFDIKIAMTFPGQVTDCL